MKIFFSFSEKLNKNLKTAMASVESEQIARTIAEENLTDLEKEKTMLQLEIKELKIRHKAELSRKESVISLVSSCFSFGFSYNQHHLKENN